MNKNVSPNYYQAALTFLFSLIISSQVSSDAFANVGAQAEGWDYALPAMIIGIAGWFIINPRFIIPNICYTIFFLWLAPNGYRVASLFAVFIYVLWFIVVIASIFFYKKDQWKLPVSLALIIILAGFINIMVSLLMLVAFAIFIPVVAIALKLDKTKKSNTDDSNPPDEQPVPEHEPDRVRSIPLRIFTALILGSIFVGQCYLASTSRPYLDYNEYHQEVLDTMDKFSQQIEDEKNRDPLHFYPSHEVFNDLKQKKGCLKAYYHSLLFDETDINNLKYYPSSDRKSYRIVYEGNIFRSSSWFILPEGYPAYDSTTGLDGGDRMSILDALYHVYLKKDVILDRTGIRQRWKYDLL